MAESQVMIVLTVVLIGVIAGLSAAGLARTAGHSWQQAVLRGGGSFGATVTMLLAVITSGAGVHLAVVNSLIAIITALVTGWLCKADGVPVWASIVRGTVAFAGVTLLALLIESYFGMF